MTNTTQQTSQPGGGRLRRTIVFTVLTAIVLAIGYIVYTEMKNTQKTALVVIDNDTTDTWTLRQQGEEDLVIEPQSVHRRMFAPGRQRILILAGQSPVFDQELTLADHGKYIVNPGATGYYVSWMAEYSTRGISFDFRKDPQAQMPEMLREVRGMKFREPAVWHTVNSDHVLENPPANIQMDAQENIARRSVLTSVNRQTIEIFQEAQKLNPKDPVSNEFAVKLNNALWLLRTITR